MTKLLFILLLALGGCTPSNTKLNDFTRLTGTWMEQNADGEFVESWVSINDTLLEGTSYMTALQDTLFKEKMQLVAQGDSIYYIPTVPDQNNGKPIRFALTKKTKNNWVFENKQHDFPTKIIYTFKGTDSLIATVQGIDHGRQRELAFRLKRDK